MKILIQNETTTTENRVALTPEGVTKLIAQFPDVSIAIQSGAGAAAHYPDLAYKTAGAEVLSNAASKKYKANILLRVSPTTSAANLAPKGALLGFLDPASHKTTLQKLVKNGHTVLPVEFIPRTSRAQSMDALSSQTNIAGYRAVLEAATHYPKFFPLMMTAAGAAKPAHVIVLGVGVAGLQAIATARRLGAQVSAFDIRPDSKEQVLSLGAKFLEFDLGEATEGEGGYAKELSPEAQAKQQELLQEAIAKADVIITTAQVPGRPAPILITEKAVQHMQAGSVIIDMAAGGYNQTNGIKGGNCPLTVADKITTTKNGVTLVGHTNYAAMAPTDASRFYSANLVHFLTLALKHTNGKTALNLNPEDDILAATQLKAE